MNHVTIGDGCSIQGSVICSNVQLQERVVLKDCQVNSFSLSLAISSAQFCLASDYYIALHYRSVQALWLLLVVCAKGRPWLGKRSEYSRKNNTNGKLIFALCSTMLMLRADFVVTAGK